MREKSMKMTKFKTSEKWANILLKDGEMILDPDGWDRENFQYSFFEEMINEEEFRRRMMFSTVVLAPQEKK
jgi:hypothetical protein